MKKKIALALSAVMLAGALFGGCGMEEKITVDGNLTSTITEDYYYTKDEVEQLKQMGTDVSMLKEVQRDGKTYYQETDTIQYTKQEFETSIGRVDNNCFVMYSSTLDDLVDSSTAEQMYAAIEFLNVSIELPFTVAASNASEIKGSTILLDKDAALKENIIYAVSDAAMLEGKDLTFSGVKDNGAYNKKKTVTVNTADGVIESISLMMGKTQQQFSSENQPYNVTTCSAEGKYTLTAKLIGGTTKSIKFTIDKTKPTSNIANNKTYKTGKKITFSDKTSGIKSAKLDGKTIKSGYKIKKKGSHKLVLTDKAGNKKTIKFKIK